MKAARARTDKQLREQIERLQTELAEARETLRAIREGEVDAIVVSGAKGEQVFSLVGAESVYRLIVETMKEAAFTVTFDGKILYCNLQFGELIRRPLEQIVGHSLQEFVAPQDQQAVESLLAISHERPVKQRIMFKHVDGAQVPAHLSANVLNQPDALSICVVATDLTELENSTAMLQQLRSQQEALRESEARYRSLFENNMDAIILSDAGGNVTAANPAACVMFGMSEQELCRSGRGIVHPDEPRLPSLLEERVRTGKVRSELSFIRKDGTKFIGEVNSIALGRHRSKWFSIVRDITDRKQAEEALLKANERLRDADRRKDEFLAMLAHELRNPLAPVRNAVQVLRLAGDREDIRCRQQDTIDRQVTHMARLLDDLLDVSRVTRGRIELRRQRLELNDVLSQAVEVVTPIIQARRHVLHFERPHDPVHVEGDIDRLAQALGNLLINAAKYTDEGGQIWLKAAREGDLAVIRVRDNGAGISPELLPQVFELFTQADHSLGHSRGGLGIGLTLVQNLIQMHGGTVEAWSEGLGRGSEFTIRIPALRTETTAVGADEARSEAAPAANGSRRVLVVDDNPDSAETLAALLGIWNHEVRTAFSGPAALQLVHQFKPELVLLDIGMPGMDGFEVARRLRAMPEMAGTVLIALTGYGQAEDVEKTRAAGFDHHMVKPVDLQALQGVLQRSLRNTSLDGRSR